MTSSVTMTVTGQYVLTLTGDDGEFQSVDDLVIDVFTDACAAAKIELPYSELNARVNGDTNYDCEVNSVDLATLALNWLDNLLE